jgi:hypothetical protein
MHRSAPKKLIAASAIAAAGWAAFAGAPGARGDFIVSVVDMYPGGITYQGNTWDVYVLAAVNDGKNNTGSTLEAAQVIIDTGGPTTFNSPTGAIGFDIEKTTGTGSNTKYNVNVNGSTPNAFGQNAINNGVPAAPEFGDITGGTFVGIGTGAFTTDLVNNPQTTQDGANSPSSKGGTAAVYLNGQTSDYVAVGNNSANYLQSFLNKSPQLDSAFENGVTPNANVISGNVSNALKNGTVHSLEVDTVSEDSSGSVLPVPDDAANGPVPFANIVIPHGTVFTIHGALAGESVGSKSFAFIPEGPPPPPARLCAQIDHSKPGFRPQHRHHQRQWR